MNPTHQFKLAGVTLRDMTPDDVTAVEVLERRLFPVDAWPLQMFFDELAQPETRRYVVAEVDGKIVAYAGLMCIEPIADVQTIAVVPEFEGKGIGSAILTELIEEARRRRRGGSAPGGPGRQSTGAGTLRAVRLRADPRASGGTTATARTPSS